MARQSRTPFQILAVTALAATLVAGCQSSADRNTEAARPLRMEQVTGADGKHLGWIRTDEATPEGGTYEVIYDANWNEIGATANPGDHYKPDGARLSGVGHYDRERGLARLTGERAVDINITEVSSRNLARSGPYSTPGAATTISNRDESGEAGEGESEDADESGDAGDAGESEEPEESNDSGAAEESDDADESDSEDE